MNTSIKAGPTVMIVFGGTGDLSKRKLIPAFYNLFIDNFLSDKFRVIGLGRTDLTDDQFRERLHEGVSQFSRRKPEDDQWNKFSTFLSYFRSDIDNGESYAQLAEKLDTIDKEWGERANRIFYLSVSPEYIAPVAVHLSEAGLTNDQDHDRIVIEKPFGHDLESARKLNILLGQKFKESQIFRIDHYLGKETVQNILAFRFANTFFEPLWNRNYIDCVKITVAEQVGVESRGDYYEGAGALRDMIQNHLLQLLCMVAMEPPISFDADEIRDKKVEVLKAIRSFSPDTINEFAIRAQYGAGKEKDKEVNGYRSEKEVSPSSNTETYAAVKFFIDNWRWQNVPFYLQTGKRLKEKASIITVQFHPVPHLSFPHEITENFLANQLLIHIQPESDLILRFQAKGPGLKMAIKPVEMVFNYEKAYASEPPEAYETLLLDVMLRDATLFMRADQVEAAWKAIMPILDNWTLNKLTDFPQYPSGASINDVAKILNQKAGNVLSEMVSTAQDV